MDRRTKRALSEWGQVLFVLFVLVVFASFLLVVAMVFTGVGIG